MKYCHHSHLECYYFILLCPHLIKKYLIWKMFRNTWYFECGCSGCQVVLKLSFIQKRKQIPWLVMGNGSFIPSLATTFHCFCWTYLIYLSDTASIFFKSDLIAYLSVIWENWLLIIINSGSNCAQFFFRIYKIFFRRTFWHCIFMTNCSFLTYPVLFKKF